MVFTFHALGKRGSLLQCIARIQEGNRAKQLRGVFSSISLSTTDMNGRRKCIMEEGVSGTMEEGINDHGEESLLLLYF